MLLGKYETLYTKREGISDMSFVEDVSAKPGHLVSMFAIRFMPGAFMHFQRTL